MRPRTRWTGLGLLLALAACSGAQEQVPASRSEPATIAADSVEARFARAYFEIGCLANAGKDPESTFTPLRNPCDYLEGLRDRGGAPLQRAVQVLQKNGFGGLEDFRALRLTLKARKDWWQDTIDARFIDELKRCK